MLNNWIMYNLSNLSNVFNFCFMYDWAYCESGFRTGTYVCTVLKHIRAFSQQHLEVSALLLSRWMK